MISVTLHLPTLTFFWCNIHQTDFKHRQVAKPCNAKSQSLVSVQPTAYSNQAGYSRKCGPSMLSYQR